MHMNVRRHAASIDSHIMDYNAKNLSFSITCQNLLKTIVCVRSIVLHCSYLMKLFLSNQRNSSNNKKAPDKTES